MDQPWHKGVNKSQCLPKIDPARLQAEESRNKAQGAANMSSAFLGGLLTTNNRYNSTGRFNNDQCEKQQSNFMKKHVLLSKNETDDHKDLMIDSNNEYPMPVANSPLIKDTEQGRHQRKQLLDSIFQNKSQMQKQPLYWLKNKENQ